MTVGPASSGLRLEISWWPVTTIVPPRLGVSPAAGRRSSPEAADRAASAVPARSPRRVIPTGLGVPLISPTPLDAPDGPARPAFPSRCRGFAGGVAIGGSARILSRRGTLWRGGDGDGDRGRRG